MKGWVPSLSQQTQWTPQYDASFLLDLFTLWVWDFCLCICIYTIYTPGACGGQEEGVGYPRTRIMESCEVLEYFDQTWLLYKNMCSDLLSHLSSHMKPDIFNDLLHLSLYATKV